MSEIIRSPDAHRTIWNAFADRGYRHGYAEGFTGDYVASQIHALRVQRDWNQSDLATKAAVTQPQISGWEASCEGVRLSSLHKLAEAFDVALVVKFVPFSQLAREAISSRADIAVPSFDEDSPEAIRAPTRPIILNASANSRTRSFSTAAPGRAPRTQISISSDSKNLQRRSFGG